MTLLSARQGKRDAILHGLTVSGAAQQGNRADQLSTAAD